MLVYLFSGNVVIVSDITGRKGGFDFGFGELQFGFIAFFLCSGCKINREGWNQNHGETTHNGRQCPQEFRCGINREYSHATKCFVDGLD